MSWPSRKERASQRGWAVSNSDVAAAGGSALYITPLIVVITIVSSVSLCVVQISVSPYHMALLLLFFPPSSHPVGREE